MDEYWQELLKYDYDWKDELDYEVHGYKSDPGGVKDNWYWYNYTQYRRIHGN